MSLAVVDASILAIFYTVDNPRRSRAATRLGAGDALFAPAHLDAELASALRGLARSHPEIDRLAPHALAHLAELPIRRMPLSPLLPRIWELRHNVTVYDAAYVVLAERLDAVLVTADARLAGASGPACRFDLIA